MTSGRHYCDLTPAFQTVTCHDAALHSSCPSMALCSECFKYLGHFLFCHWSLLDHVSQDPGLPRKTTGIHRSVPIGIRDPERSRNSPGSTVASKNGGDPQKPPGLTGIHRGPIGDPGRPFHRRNGVVGEEVHALRGAQCGQEPGPECLVSVTCQAAALL